MCLMKKEEKKISNWKYVVRDAEDENTKQKKTFVVKQNP